ncbi:unnamed protein product [Rotaria sordida]|uniref:Uncharacterized protein n=1 Tax=Rotaria sordida TaxID=392033 RepID=A0A819TMB5_9BILA|nr:unnamed protein product [Rotaria sordida]CAF4077158.1 unnamed protein product [Rotaria sordida]
MENLVVKCLNKREKCFEINRCPIWLLSILPSRIKSIEINICNDNEEKSKDLIDISPYKLISSIPLLNEYREYYKSKSNIEYPNEISFEYDSISNYSQLIYSPSNQQFNYLFKKLKQFKKDKNIKLLNEKNLICRKENCFNRRIPLTYFCKIHLLEYDYKQILFVKCSHCQQISIKQDKNSILHHCYYQI